jgi:hypothetical protein
MSLTFIPLNAPLITTEEVIDALRLTTPSEWNIPIYAEFPSNSDIVRYGIYVSDVHTIERSVHQLGIQYCGSIYHAVDSFGVTYVSYQDDPYNVQVNAIIANLVTDEVDGKQLMDGYFERTFSQDLFYGPQAEKHTWTFRMTRLEFNT